MPISQNTYTVPNNFVQQYDLGQKKIRADLVDENFTDAAGAINTLLTDDANTVHLTGAETISGAKTFSAAITASGGVTGNVTGNVTGDVTGNAGTASALQTARTINGVSFNGTANITVADSTKVALDGSNLSGATVKTVVETWHSGTEWYRVWSDGWIEQGGFIDTGSSDNGKAVKSFNKPFSNANYTIILAFKTTGDGYSSSFNATYLDASNVSSSSFTYYTHTSIGLTRSWYACGY